MSSDIRIIRAGTECAESIAEFLHRQDVRPAARRDDLSLFCRRSDAALYCALFQDTIAGVAGCVQDGSVLHIAYFAVGASTPEAADIMVQALEAHGRERGAALVSVQALRESPLHQRLARLGFETQWEERDRDGQRAVTVVDLVKLL